MTEVREIVIEDVKFEWGEAHIHFVDLDDDPNCFTLDVGSKMEHMGIEGWVTIEGDLDRPPGSWNLFQVSVQLRHTYDTVVGLADIDNIDRDLEDFPDLLAFAQRAIDELKKHDNWPKEVKNEA